MNGSADNFTAWFVEVRARLEKMAREFPTDDPRRGLVAVIPVQGGVFRHPLTGQDIKELTVYACGPERVKIVSPRFLYSLPPLSLQQVVSAPQFCALVARRLGEQLGRLGKLRDRLLAMGIFVDLVEDALLLRGQVKLAGRTLGVAAWQRQRLVVESLDGTSLHGLPVESRNLELGGEPTGDLEALARLADGLAGADATPAEAEQEDVLELTEAMEEAATETAPAPPVAEPGLEPLDLEELLEKLGSDTRVSAYGGRLRFEARLKVVQGQYRFYLEQRGPRRLVGYLLTPGGTRAPVDFELGQVLDLKEVLDAYLAGG